MARAQAKEEKRDEKDIEKEATVAQGIGTSRGNVSGSSAGGKGSISGNSAGGKGSISGNSGSGAGGRGNGSGSGSGSGSYSDVGISRVIIARWQVAVMFNKMDSDASLMATIETSVTKTLCL
jgi:hypothetical protein